MNDIPRRDALKALAMLGGAVLTTGCTPTKILLHWYPSKFDSDDRLVDDVLAAFGNAVVPHEHATPGAQARVFRDDRFPLHKYRGYLASDLCSRAGDCIGDRRFERLGRADRTRVIEDGLSADETTRKLYTGAIFLTQIACYAGIYDDETGCPAIGFEGRYRPRPLAERTYRNVDDFLAREVGFRGNYL